MLTEVSALPPEVSENLGLSGLLLVRATVSVLEGLDGLPKLSGLQTVILPARGLDVAPQLRAEDMKTTLLAAAALTVSVWVTVELKAPLPVAVFVFNDAAASEIYTLSLHDALPILTEVSALPPEVSENLGLSGLLLVRATVSVLEGLDGLPK